MEHNQNALVSEFRGENDISTKLDNYYVEMQQLCNQYFYSSEKCTPFIGFEESYLRIKEGETKRVCLKTCSCYLSSNLTLETKVYSQDEGE